MTNYEPLQTTATNKKYRYGPSDIKILVCVALSIVAALAGVYVGEQGETLGHIVAAGFLGFAGLGLVGLYSGKRYIDFTENSVSIPRSVIFPRVAVIPYSDLVDVQKTYYSQVPVLRVTHRSGHVDIPYHALSYVDVDVLCSELQLRMKATA